MQTIEAACRRSLQTEGNLTSLLLTGVNMLYYSIFKRKTRLNGDLFFMQKDSMLFAKAPQLFDPQIDVEHGQR